MSKKLRIAWFSEYKFKAETSLSLSAYCSELLLPILAKQFEIELFSDNPLAVSQNLPVYHFVTSFRRHTDNPFDLFFYQLEDSKRSRFVRLHLGLMPGIVWMHDLYFQDQGPEGLFTSTWERNLEQFWNKDTEFHKRSHAPHQLWPQGIREASLSSALLFSSRWAMKEYSRMISKHLENSPGAQQVEYLGIPLEAPLASAKGSRPGALRLAYSGSAGVEGRAHKLFAALSSVQAECQLTWMIAASEQGRAQSLVDEFSLAGKVKIIEGRNPDNWFKILKNSDIALHLHRSPFFHLAPYLQISLASGLPVVVTDSAEGSTLPQEQVFSINPGMFESAEIKCLLEQLSSRGTSEFLGKAKQYVLENNLEAVSQRLLEFILSNVQAVKECAIRWEELQRRARHALIQEVIEINGTADEKAAAEMLLKPFVKEFGWEPDESR